MNKSERPTIERLRALLEYDPATGLFRWRSPSVRQAKGWFKGNKSVRQYRRLYIDGQHYMAHVIARVLVTGEWPRERTDHRDRAQGNNRWRNLRPASQAQNGMNRSVNKNSKTGVSGVTLLPSGRYRATITVDRKHIALGCFATLDAAAAARRAGEIHHYGEFAP